MKIPELLAPAGNMEKGLTAIEYGADALYLSGKQFGMRAGAGNFDLHAIDEIVQIAHSRGVKIYVTVNVIPHNNEIDQLPEYLSELADIAIDGIILADPGVMRLAKNYAPNIPLHLSTQANTVNYESAKFWAELGFTRLVMARELSQQDIARISEETDAEIEVFVHGAMCMAYSGRCLLSNVLTGRDANRGACAQSCRWKYAVVEEKRPGEYMPLEEDEGGTHIFNSKDLCLIEHIPELVASGVNSLKIEGRMKSSYYVATIVRAYRQALDLYAQDPENYSLPQDLRSELDKISHRPYWTGFFIPTNEAGIHLPTGSYFQTHDIVGIVREYNEETQSAVVEVKNKMVVGDVVEVMQPKGPLFKTTITELTRDSGEKLQEAHANYTVDIPMEKTTPYAMLRVERHADNS